MDYIYEGPSITHPETGHHLSVGQWVDVPVYKGMVHVAGNEGWQVDRILGGKHGLVKLTKGDRYTWTLCMVLCLPVDPPEKELPPMVFRAFKVGPKVSRAESLRSHPSNGVKTPAEQIAQDFADGGTLRRAEIVKDLARELSKVTGDHSVKLSVATYGRDGRRTDSFGARHTAPEPVFTVVSKTYCAGAPLKDIPEFAGDTPAYFRCPEHQSVRWYAVHPLKTGWFSNSMPKGAQCPTGCTAELGDYQLTAEYVVPAQA